MSDSKVGAVERDTIAKIIDPDAWHETLPTDGCGVYWIGRRNKARRQAEDIIDVLRLVPALDALSVLIGHDDRFQIMVGGNPRAVDQMLTHARASHAHSSQFLTTQEKPS